MKERSLVKVVYVVLEPQYQSAGKNAEKNAGCFKEKVRAT